MNTTNTWRAGSVGRRTSFGMPTAQHRFDATAIRRARGWTGTTWRDLR
ncbi:MAG TPA: hypothetical protein VK903_09360 [Propionicimonas sp.]|nr:hypothetical protein [Propionicimonas sp.]